tara:strand:+ start:25979 stop:27073 length:1095 start_codon:yes stop_codon:yes gene_type:complete
MKKIIRIIKKILGIPFAVVKGAANFAYEILRAFKRMIVLVVKSPLLLSIQAYKKGVIIRDYIFAKIDYLDQESKKWHRFFQVVSSPYSFLLKLGFSPQMAMSFLAVGSTVGTGVVVNETILAERSFSNRDAGVYLAPSEIPNSELEEQFKNEVTTNTLRVLLNDTPVETITISDVNVGTSYASNGQASALPEGKTEAILIDGNNTRIEIGKLIFSRNSCKTLNLENINANKITIRDNQADGLSVYQTASSTIPNLRVSGGYYMSDLLQTEGGLYDRIHISPLDSMTSSSTYVNELNLINIVSSGGSCDLKKLDVGEIEITFNRVGGDNSLVTKALTVSSTVASANWAVNGNVEVLMGEVARKPD